MRQGPQIFDGEAMLSAYPVITDIVVRWHEVDSLGIVNNAVYYHYFETARIQYHERLGLPAPTQRTGDEGVILASNSCRYRIPVTYPDTLSIGSRVTSVGDDHFTMEYAALSREQGKIVAVGEALVVMYNYLERRPAAMSRDLHAAIVALEGRELPAAPPRRRRKDSTQ